MRSSWLFSASAALVCAAALAKSYTVPKPAEELHYDQAGNLVWQDEVVESVPSLGRPDFSGLQVVDAEAHHLRPAMEQTAQTVKGGLSKVMKELDSVLSWAEHEIDELEHAVDDAVSGAKKQAGEWAKTGKVIVEGMECEYNHHILLI